MHALLARQLKRCGIIDPLAAPDVGAWAALLDRMSRSYAEADQERYVMERSLDLSSREMRELYTALAEERDTLQAVQRSLGDGLLVLDVEGRVISLNPAAERLLGRGETDLLGSDGLATCGIDAYSPNVGNLRDLVAASRDHREEDARVERPDGSIVPIAFVLTPLLREGRPAGAVLVFRDVSDRQRAEAERTRRIRGEAARAEAEAGREAFRYQNALLEAQSEASIDGILVVSNDGTMSSFNRRFVELWGISAEVVERRSDAEALAAVSDALVDPDEFFGRVTYLYAHPDETSREEVQLRDGRTFDRYSAPVRADAAHYGRLWTFRDVTEHKRSVEVLATLQAVSAEVAAALDSRSLAALVVTRLHQRFGYELPSLYLLESDDKLHLAAEDGDGASAQRLAPESGVIGRAVRLRQSVLVQDARADHDFVATTPGITAQACVPILVGEELRGVLNVEARRAGSLDGRDLALLEALARIVAVSLENARLFRASQTDLAERERAEAELRAKEAVHAAQNQSEERFRALVQNASDVIAILQADGTIRYQSPASERVWGYRPERLDGTSLLDLVHADDQNAARVILGDIAKQPGKTCSIQLRLRHADGAWREFELFAANMLDRPAVNGIVVTCRDVTERVAFEQQLRQLAFHDSLTDLPNRALFGNRLESALVRADRQSSLVGVLFIDLDNFKVVNDSLGHEVGDQLLVAVADRLRACARPGDTVARLGGDEFTVLLEDVAGDYEATATAERIGAALRAPFVLRGRDVFVSASIGVASTSGGLAADSLLRNADLALYRAKAKGKARYAVFEPSMEAGALERLELESALRRALQRGEFELHYQPILTFGDGRIAAVEALLRWHHPQRGPIAPSVFIPLAEETGLIVRIGQWVLETACRQARRWQLEHYSDPPLVLCVNLSPRQFQHPELVADIQRAIRQAGLDPHTLELEITESALMQDADAAVVTLDALKALGIRFAVDDFGTGYSSLAYLKRFPVDTLKIDRSFVDGLGHDSQDEAIVRSVVTLAKTLGLSVTGEGVETEAQEAYLQALGCDHGQGYLYARPLPVVEFSTLLAQQTPQRHLRAA